MGPGVRKPTEEAGDRKFRNVQHLIEPDSGEKQAGEDLNLKDSVAAEPLPDNEEQRMRNSDDEPNDSGRWDPQAHSQGHLSMAEENA